MSDNYKCDSCGTKNPETFEGGRLTKCCATTDREKGFYTVKTKDGKDKNGKQLYANGKTWSC